MLSKGDGVLIAHWCLALCGHVSEKSCFQEKGAYRVELHICFCDEEFFFCSQHQEMVEHTESPSGSIYIICHLFKVIGLICGEEK